MGVARMLLEAGADVETPDNYGQSPFFMACWKGETIGKLVAIVEGRCCRTTSDDVRWKGCNITNP